jgi:ABC-type multidrug transport system ATPase subunit
MAPALELVDAVKDYPAPRRFREFWASPFRRKRKRALDGVSFAVEPGEVVVLLGPNGSGKTTTVKLLAGLVRPSSGAALVAGIDAAVAPERAQAQIGYVTGDERSFYWRLDYRENLRFFAALQGLHGRAGQERIDEVAAALDLRGLERKPFRTLSSGQRARVAIARGLLHRPRALLLDEVTRTLDPGAAERLRRLVVDDLAGRERLGVLLTTHDLHEARAMASRVVLLVDGRVRARGRWDEVEGAIDRTFFAEEA